MYTNICIDKDIISDYRKNNCFNNLYTELIDIKSVIFFLKKITVKVCAILLQFIFFIYKNQE